MNSNLGKQKLYLVYQITNLLNNMIYVGAHVTYNVNDKYMGSSKYLKKDMKELGRQNFRKKILHVFDNMKDMQLKEAEIVNRKFCHREDTYNRMVGGISEINWTDLIITKDKEGIIHSVYNDDPRWLSGELVGIAKGNQYTKGKVSVKDLNGNTFQIDKTDPRYLSGELVHVAKGQKGNSQFLGKNHKEETKKLMSEKAELRVKEKNSMFGKTRSEEFKSDLRDKFGIEFFIYDKEGNFVSKEKSVSEYAVMTGMNPSSIIKVLKGKYKHSNQLRFFYEFQGDYISSLN